MKRFFFATMFMILAIGIGWRYAPPDARERMLGFIGMATNRADPKRVAQGIKEKIMPEDPAATRAAIVGTLKQKIQEIKEGVGVEKNAGGSGASALTGAPTPAARAAAIAKAADEAAQLVGQLEQSGTSGSASGQIIQRVLDKILPATQCKE